jgi:tRNA-dihydrouridine synthase B
LPPPSADEARTLLLAHLDDHYRFYGESLGLRTARKHIIWYTFQLDGGRAFCDYMNTLTSTAEQARAVDRFLTEHGTRYAHLTYLDAQRPTLH